MDNTTVYIDFDEMTKAMTERLADKPDIVALEDFKPYKPMYAAGYEIPIRLHRTNNRKKRRFINLLKAMKLSFKRSDTSERVYL